jgi:hypothetical protein
MGLASVVGVSDIYGVTRINLRKNVPARPIPKIVAGEFPWSETLANHWRDVV